MNRILPILFFMLFALKISATHNRAGEITYRQIGPLTYEVTITTYTKADAPADRCDLTILWGDNTQSVLARINGPSGINGCMHMGVMVDNNIKKNVYVGVHTFPANGTYTLSMLDPNRNEGVLNISNSVNEQFYIQSIIKIGTGLGNNSSPTLLNPPTDFGCVNVPYVHNVSAYDTDGDSLSYKMVYCRGNDGREIETTYTPAYNLDKIKVDAQGTITWNTPIFQGIYNVAIEISEHRRDPRTNQWITIGRILRDMQIDITACNNDPPEIIMPNSFCVTAGDQLTFDVQADDPNGDNVSLTAVGGPFETIPAAVFNDIIYSSPPITSSFVWNTDLALSRRAPYQVTFKANDYPFDPYGNPIPGLSAQKVVEIKVLAPGVENLKSVQSTISPSFDLSWDKTNIPNTKGYKIYRKRDNGNYIPNNCYGGLPAGSGFELIATIEDPSLTNYNDNNNQNYFLYGVSYCYVVTNILFDDSESLPSASSCINLKKVLPVITNVSVETTSYSNGQMTVIWSKPTDFDAVLYPGPYAYKLFRSEGKNSVNYTQIASFSSLNDTIYSDSNLNTYDNIYRYRVDFFNNSAGVEQEIGKSNPASSSYLSITSGDGKLLLDLDKNVPWKIDSIKFYQELGQTLTFNFIGSSNGTPMVVDNLNNGSEYCFKAESFGSYSIPGFSEPFLNKTQIACAIPNINVLKCPPSLSSENDCSRAIFNLIWTNPNLSCDEKITGYNIYHSADQNGTFIKIASLTGENTNHWDVLANNIEYGCFYITGVDALGNETIASNTICYEPCIDIKLPNIFTPNQDGVNDYFRPQTYSQSGALDENLNFDVSRFDIEIFNRYGNRVFKTDRVEINWDGTNLYTNKPCPEGVYYYVCTVVKDVGDGEEISFKLTGYTHLIR